MDADAVIDIARDALVVLIVISTPLMLSALIVGLLIGMLQAATQINEMTLSFIPKILVIIIVLSIGGTWMLEVIVTYTHELFSSIPSAIG